MKRRSFLKHFGVLCAFVPCLAYLLSGAETVGLQVGPDVPSTGELSHHADGMRYWLDNFKYQDLPCGNPHTSGRAVDIGGRQLFMDPRVVAKVKYWARTRVSYGAWPT